MCISQYIDIQYTNVYLYNYICIYVCAYICEQSSRLQLWFQLYICVCTHIYTIHIHMYVHIYIRLYIHTHTNMYSWNHSWLLWRRESTHNIISKLYTWMNKYSGSALNIVSCHHHPLRTTTLESVAEMLSLTKVTYLEGVRVRILTQVWSQSPTIDPRAP